MFMYFTVGCIKNRTELNYSDYLDGAKRVKRSFDKFTDIYTISIPDNKRDTKYGQIYFRPFCSYHKDSVNVKT